MSRLLRRFVNRDLPLAKRFQRGVRTGFAVAAVLGIATLLLTEVTSTSLEDDVSASHELATQRAEVARLSGLVSLLAGADDLARANTLRIEIGTIVADVERRQVALQIKDGSLATTEVAFGLDRRAVRFDRAFELAMTETADAVEALADPTLLAGFRQDAVNDAVVLLQSLDSAYELRAEESAWAALATSTDLRDFGRWLAAVSLVAAALRLLVLGRPLVQRLVVEYEDHRQSEQQQADAQTRSIVSSRLAEGMESVHDEPGVGGVVERTLARLVPSRPAEMLLADSSKAHLGLHARNPLLPAPGCDVQSPSSCPAVRRARTQVFEDSDGLRACPHLAGRSGGACSAVCVPVAAAGDSMGVLHATGEAGSPPTEFDVFALEALAGQAAMRLGSIRSFARAEIQASTDVLTGLPNRRAVQDNLSRFLASRTQGSVAIADLDHFKDLNDHFGHEAGDRALRLFAEVLRTSLRDDDIAGRWGGEEFVVVLPGLLAREGSAILDRIRTELALACASSEGPAFTVSIGVVDTSAGTGLDTLVRLADESLYAAKQGGRDRVVVGPIPDADAGAPAAGENREISA